jgi:hypothetical protein
MLSQLWGGGRFEVATEAGGAPTAFTFGDKVRTMEADDETLYSLSSGTLHGNCHFPPAGESCLAHCQALPTPPLKFTCVLRRFMS